MSAIGGVSLLAVGAFAYQAVVGMAERVARETATTLIESADYVAKLQEDAISAINAYPVDPGLTTSCAVLRTGSRDFSLRDR